MHAKKLYHALVEAGARHDGAGVRKENYFALAFVVALEKRKIHAKTNVTTEQYSWWQ